MLAYRMMIFMLLSVVTRDALCDESIFSTDFFGFGKASSLFKSRDTSSKDELSFNRFSRTHENSYEYWGLTKEEWTRYEQLKKDSPFAVWENHSSPLAVLCFYADSLEEKQRYARLEAELDQWRQNAVVEFQTLYDRERAIVFAEYESKIANRLPVLSNITPSDHLRLFVRAGNCDVHCRTVVKRVLDTQAHIDIFVAGATNNDEIFAWATSANVPVERVKVKQVTLNHEQNLLKMVSESAGVAIPDYPSLFKIIDSHTNVQVAL